MVAILLAVFTAGIWFFASNIIQEKSELQFLSDVDSITESIESRLYVYTNVLNGGKGLFAASKSVERDEWEQYIKSLQIEEYYPGIQGVGYAVWVPADQLDAHIEFVRAEGFPEYIVKPVGERDQYTAIVYLEPFDIRNQQAFGFDMFQESTRNEAMTRAVNSGEPALSGKVTLVQEIDEDVQSGFLIYVPFYKNGEVIESAQQRMEYIQGFVYSPFRMNDFMEGIGIAEGEKISIEVFDAESPIGLSKERQMFEDNIRLEDNTFSETRTIAFGGHGWTIRYSAEKSYNQADFEKNIPWAFLIFGALLTFLVPSLLYVFSSRRKEAQTLAKDITKDLEAKVEENEKFRKDLEIQNGTLSKNEKLLKEKLEELEKANNLMIGRELRIKELKEELKILK